MKHLIALTITINVRIAPFTKSLRIRPSGSILLLVACAFLVPQAIYGLETDSLNRKPDIILHPSHGYSAANAFKTDFTYMGAGFIAAGFLVKSQKKEFRAMRHYFKPNFQTTWDNYTQYTPLIATWALKAFGVEGRSSWKRMATSNAFSALTMAFLVNSLKYSTKELRPDGTSRNSFPSGHTATSFVFATILHKEYGLTRSPWYSIAGYSVATTTGVCRILNNRHWINDVLVGAGIGILSTDIGYFVGDLLFKNKGIKHSSFDHVAPDISGHPSFLGISVQMGIGPKQLNAPEVYDDYDEHMQPYPEGDPKGTSHPLGLKLYMGHSSSVSVEGAYFFNKYVGVGGRVRATAIPVTARVDLSKGFVYDTNLDGKADDDAKFTHFVGVESNHIGMFDFSAGVHVSYPINNRLRIGSKWLVGNRLTTDYSVDAILDIDVEGIRRKLSTIDENDMNYFQYPGQKQEILESLKSYGDGKNVHDTEFLSIQSNNTPVYSTGLSLAWAYRQDMAFRVTFDYDYSSPHYTYQLTNRWKDVGDGFPEYLIDTFTHRTKMHNLSMGLGMTLSF